jgi:hypothetical protein
MPTEKAQQKMSSQDKKKGCPSLSSLSGFGQFIPDQMPKP